MKQDKKDIQGNISSSFFSDTLVRFRAISFNNLEALKNDRLYYSTPNNFNDLYDTLIYANYLQILQDVSHNIENGMDSYLEQLKNKDIQNAKNIAGIGYVMWNGSNRDKLLDGFFQQIGEAVKTVKETLHRNVRIICFSEEYLSMLMWSHYADNHKGFAIVYDRNDIENAENYTNSGEPIRKKSLLKQVTYAEVQTDLTLEIEDYVRVHHMPHLGDVSAPIPNLSQDKLRRMMTEKSPDWSYEKEWRVIPRHISLKQESNLGYMYVKPKAVILGSKCSIESQRRIIDICNGKRIRAFQADLNYLEPGYKLMLRTPDI